MHTQRLDWDSAILGFPVAKILAPHLDGDTLENVLSQLKAEGIWLVYWASAAPYPRGLLVDRKTTYVMDLPTAIVPSTEIVEYTDPLPSPTLMELALESGHYSRFRQDPHITDVQFKAIYHAWITNSTRHRVADKVLVSREHTTLKGFVTLGEKQGRGDIGLLAVAPAHRGLGLGKKLVYAALNYFMDQGYAQSQVVTQGANLSACRLYAACGYRIERIDYFYHFWLAEST